ncbi:MAG: chromosomal replication initiator protein DnaA [Erysipelotrichaceae bacterium]|nr:chromosomal replication initiator protein DnaA [Erysipelotrichaceae bacterium]
MYSYSNIWDRVKEVIRTTLYGDSNDGSDIVYMEFYNDTELVELTETEATVLVKYNVHYHVLNDNENLNIINNALKQVLNKDIRCRILTEDTYRKLSAENVYNTRMEDNVMPQYLFENFVVGPSNKESYMAALAVAMNPGRKTYNPLFIYGDSGLGKTHLLCAIGNYIKNKFPERKILYTPCMDYINNVGKAIKNKTIEDYKNRLNSLDVFIVDDIQTLAGKEKSKEIFFNVFNELYDNGKQIILASDRPPVRIKDVEARLVSRFSQGLSVTVSSPEFETAYKILEMKIRSLGMEENSIDPEVISFLATNFSSDVRKLEGSLNRLLFYSINFSNSNTINLDLALEAFKNDLNTIPNKNELKIKDVINAVIDYYGLEKNLLVGKARTQKVATPRHIAMYLCRKHLDVSYLKIGEEFGGRDHTTVLSACEKIEKLIKTNDDYKKVIREIETSMLR